MTKPTKKTRNPDPMTAATKAMTGFNPMQQSLMKAWAEMGTEALRFASARLQRDMETQKAMLACTNLEELRKVQAEFYNDAIKDYGEEVSRMMEIMTETAADAGDTVAAGTRRTYDDVPL